MGCWRGDGWRNSCKKELVDFAIKDQKYLQTNYKRKNLSILLLLNSVPKQLFCAILNITI